MSEQPNDARRSRIGVDPKLPTKSDAKAKPQATDQAQSTNVENRPTQLAQKAQSDSKPKPQQRASTVDWYAILKDKKLSKEDVSKAVEKLHAAKNHAEAIALIEAALALGQSQSWMYDVLAMSMKADGRAEEDIERVLLSRVDFTASDINSVLVSAAFLVRLEAKNAGLKLYQQASRLDPSRPEPYLLALKLAQELKDPEAVRWAAVGILETTWTKDREKRQQDAEDIANDVIRQLQKIGKAAEANQLKDAIAEAKRRDLIVRLEWDGDADLDLEIVEPFGTSCSVKDPLSAGGGVLTHDGYGPKAKNCYEEYVSVKGGSGAYRAKVTVVGGNVVGKRCTLVVKRHVGSRDEEVERIPMTLDKPTTETAFILSNGRRKEKGEAPKREAASHRPTRQELLAKLMTDTLPNSVRANAGFAQFGGGGAGGNTILQTGGTRPAGTVGYQPVIGVVNDGISMTVSALISADRRYVKLAISPAFNALVEVATFSFSN